ncbi:MAG: hypothetical protein C3F13_05140 [Anaerolineales bacterium]|nr:hypothetical protein [Anaerolineae bacterium]PWB55108.1 MAG: hypothetical protein C3F13_05140 [Anaerolineales bacterium]
MKHNRSIVIIITLLSMAAILLSACATDTGPVTLTVNGMVNKELQLTDQALHKLPVVTLTLEHPKNGPTEYTGVRLNDILNEAGIKDGAATVTLSASDGFSSDIDLATIQACTDCLVSFDPETAGVYNAAMPGQSSKAWVKQLTGISVK